MEFTTGFFVFICGISESVLPDDVPKQKGAATILLLPIYKVLVVILPARMMYRTPAAQPLTSLLFVLRPALHPAPQTAALFPDLQEDAKHSYGNFLLSSQITKSAYPELVTYYKTSYLHHWLYQPCCIALPIRTIEPSFILFAGISILLSKKKGASVEPPPVTVPTSICNLIAIGITPTCVGKRLRHFLHCRESQDHPHACGEKGPHQRNRPQKVGSPPRVWGKAELCERRVYKWKN